MWFANTHTETKKKKKSCWGAAASVSLGSILRCNSRHGHSSEGGARQAEGWKREKGASLLKVTWPDSSFCSSRSCQLEEMSPAVAAVLRRSLWGPTPPSCDLHHPLDGVKGDPIKTRRGERARLEANSPQLPREMGHAR